MFLQSTSIFKSNQTSLQKPLRNTVIIFSFLIGVMSFGYDAGYLKENQPYTGARESWLQCINDIQDHTMRSLSDVISRAKVHSNTKPPLLYIDPAYGGNAGDNFIAYGSLVFIERMGFLNHTECNVYASQGFSPGCGNFSHFEEGGLAIWHGGGNWGDLWGREVLGLKRLHSITTLANKGKIVIGFPQSIHYNNKNLQTQDAEMFMGNLSDIKREGAKENIILTWRQENSFTLAKELYPLARNR